MPPNLLSPLHWHTWFGLGVLRLFEFLPYPLLIAAGKLIGKLARRVIPGYVKVARCNMRLCLPESCETEREKLLSRHFEGLGIAVCESAMTWWSSNERICKLSVIEGLPHLQQAAAQGRGVILLTAHFTTLEIGARILNAVFPINVLYRPLKNPVLAWMAERSRAQHARRVIRRDDVRSMVRALKNNECVWYAPDQSYRKKGAAMVHFFGVPAATNVSTSRLAKLTGAAVLLYSHERLPDGKGYRVVIHPALDGYPGNCPEADAERFNHFIEDEVRRIPEQYWWIHRRFKGLSADYPNYYRAS
jgi:Kdo2-lipid IVA lauroyltransferase/acyltransferase